MSPQFLCYNIIILLFYVLTADFYIVFLREFLMVDKGNFTSSSFDIFDINLVQKEVDGGSVSIDQIDEAVGNNSNAKSIIISGLKQDTFDYFVKKYGQQFKAISFWKNKLVEDISLLGTLKDIQFINYFFNQRAISLWDMSDNKALKGLGIYDFSKLHSINEIESSTNLEFFGIGDMVWAGMVIDSLKPIANTKIRHFEWCGKKVSDNDYRCLAEGNIEILDINPTRFTLDELTELLAFFPESLSGSITKPYITGSIGKAGSNEHTTLNYLCKNKKACVVGKDDKRFQKYLKDFEYLLEEKRHMLHLIK